MIAAAPVILLWLSQVIQTIQGIWTTQRGQSKQYSQQKIPWAIPQQRLAKWRISVTAFCWFHKQLCSHSRRAHSSSNTEIRHPNTYQIKLRGRWHCWENIIFAALVYDKVTVFRKNLTTIVKEVLWFWPATQNISKVNEYLKIFHVKQKF